MDVSPTTAPPQLSPDGQWRWDGQQWLPAQQIPDSATTAPRLTQDVLPSQEQRTAQWPAASATTHDGLAIASLVLAILWVFSFGSFAAILCGHVSRMRARQAGARPSGVALAGLVLGYAGCLLMVVAALAAVAIPTFLQQRHDAAVASVASVADSAGVPDVVEAKFGGSPLTPEQFGRTVADLEAHRRACALTVSEPAIPAALTYAAIQYDTHFEETLLSWSLEAAAGQSTPEQRAEMVRLDSKKLAAIEASPDLARTAAPLIAAMKQYDDLLAASLAPSAWASNSETARALNARRAAAAAELRTTLGVVSPKCVVHRP